VNFVFHPSAREELNRAVDYYEDCETGLGYDFLEEVYAAIKRIQACCLTHRFPYSVVSLVKNARIFIVAVANSHQKPDYWQHRVPEENTDKKQKKSR